MLPALAHTAPHTSDAGRAGTQVSDLASGALSSPKVSRPKRLACRWIDACLCPAFPCSSLQTRGPSCHSAEPRLLSAWLPSFPESGCGLRGMSSPGSGPAQVGLTHDAGLSVGKEGACSLWPQLQEQTDWKRKGQPVQFGQVSVRISVLSVPPFTHL